MSASTVLTCLKQTHYDISPEEYRDKWGLPSDYPIVFQPAEEAGAGGTA